MNMNSQVERYMHNLFGTWYDLFLIWTKHILISSSQLTIIQISNAPIRPHKKYLKATKIFDTIYYWVDKQIDCITYSSILFENNR